MAFVCLCQGNSDGRLQLIVNLFTCVNISLRVVEVSDPASGSTFCRREGFVAVGGYNESLRPADPAGRSLRKAALGENELSLSSSDENVW